MSARTRDGAQPLPASSNWRARSWRERETMRCVRLTSTLPTGWGRWTKADDLMAAEPSDPGPPDLALIAEPDVRDRWDASLVRVQQTAIARRRSEPTPTARSPAEVEEVVGLKADLVVLFAEQERRIARNERPLRLADTPERRAKRADLAARASKQFKAYLQAGLVPPDERGEEA
jgi:hypothetical protein